jgi:hypothetical protein
VAAPLVIVGGDYRIVISLSPAYRGGTAFDRWDVMRFALLGALLLLTGCVAAPTPLPQPDAETVAVVVRVLAYGSEEPIAAATVLRDTLPIGATGTDGVFVFRVTRGTTIVLEAIKQGYADSVSAAGEVNGANERWTFYLEPDPVS